NAYWWQYCRYVWSPDLNDAIDRHFVYRRNRLNGQWFESIEPDWITSEIIMSLPDHEAEMLLIKHWDHLKYEAHFFQAALYTATKELLKLAGLAFDECPSRAKLLTHVSQRFGIMCNGRRG